MPLPAPGQAKEFMTTQPAASRFVTDDATPDACDALLIIGHGTRDPAGLAEFRSFVDQVARQRTDWHVTGCFLELAEPSIATAVDRLAASGLPRIRAMPLMLFSARPRQARYSRTPWARRWPEIPAVDIELCPPLGCHPADPRTLAGARCRQALVGQRRGIGRRNSVDSGWAGQLRFRGDRRDAAAVPICGNVAGEQLVRTVDVGFVAVATPSLGERCSSGRPEPIFAA